LDCYNRWSFEFWALINCFSSVCVGMLRAFSRFRPVKFSPLISSLMFLYCCSSFMFESLPEITLLRELCCEYEFAFPTMSIFLETYWIFLRSCESLMALAPGLKSFNFAENSLDFIVSWPDSPSTSLELLFNLCLPSTSTERASSISCS